MPAKQAELRFDLLDGIPVTTMAVHAQYVSREWTDSRQQASLNSGNLQLDADKLRCFYAAKTNTFHTLP